MRKERRRREKKKEEKDERDGMEGARGSCAIYVWPVPGIMSVINYAWFIVQGQRCRGLVLCRWNGTRGLDTISALLGCTHPFNSNCRTMRSIQSASAAVMLKSTGGGTVCQSRNRTGEYGVYGV